MYWGAFLEYQSKLGAILFDQSNKMICTDPSRLSKAMAMIFGPQTTFLWR